MKKKRPDPVSAHPPVDAEWAGELTPQLGPGPVSQRHRERFLLPSRSTDPTALPSAEDTGVRTWER